ncbi:hypothetical protein BDN70DRAFT_107691 [Pholiota conissans]|uniref:Uncharacterized protein n=1 Tax=Pholiota conissans TaxID=109636 RepID=A0A9P5ZCX4_9AGAR|nr:hypothetical protein BDN70DRAFT_107691 [Pholiota conissans]
MRMIMSASIATLASLLITPLFGGLFILSSSATAKLVRRGEISDAIPPECTETCSVISTALETCVYGDCLCTDSNAQELESCMNCLLGISSTSSVYDAAQGALTGGLFVVHHPSLSC